MLLKVQCEKCKTKYKLDDSRIQGKGAKITCPRCRHVFVVMKDSVRPEDYDGADGEASDLQDEPGGGAGGAGPESAAVGPLGESTPSVGSVPRPTSADTLSWKEVGLTTFKVKVAIGLVYDFSDISTLRKYISEKRVAPTDRLSFDGKVWHVIKDIPSLDEFFIDQWMALKHEKLLEEQRSAPKPAAGGGAPEVKRAEKGSAGVRQTVYNPNVPDAGSLKQEDGGRRTAWSADAGRESAGEPKGLLGQDLFDDFAHEEAGGASSTPATARRPAGAEVPLSPSTGSAVRRTDGGPTAAGVTRDRPLPPQEKPRSLSGFEVLTLIVLIGVTGYLGWRYMSEAAVAQTPAAAADPQTGIPELEQLLQQHFPVAIAASRQGQTSPEPAAVPGGEERRKPTGREEGPRTAVERDGGKNAEREQKVKKEPGKGAAAKGGAAISVSAITAEDLFQLGQESLRMKDYDGAIQSLKSAVEMKPGNENFQYTLGYALFLAGRYPDAEAALKKSLALNKGRREAHKWLGDVYARQGNKALAIESYKKYLEGSPRDAEAIRAKIDKLTNS